MKAMHFLGQFLFGASLAAALFLPPEASGAEKAEPIAVKGEKLYTQFSLYYEKDHHITTNYRKGILVPINTEVEFVKAGRNRLTVKIPGYNATVHIENEEDYSGERIAGIFKRTLGREAVNLSQFSELEQSMIKKGSAAAGMSKEAVIKAMGYPPRHKTPSLNMDEWRYWQNRFDTILVVFEKEKVTAIRD